MRLALFLLLVELCNLDSSQNVNTETTILMNDPRLIYTRAGPRISFQDYTAEGDKWQPNLCGSFINIDTHGDSVTLPFSGTSVTVNLLLDQLSGLFIMYYDTLQAARGNSFGGTSVLSGNCQVSSLTSDALEARNHTFTIANMSGASLYIHSITYSPYGQQPSTPSIPSAAPSGSKTPLIAGIAGGVGGLLFLIFFAAVRTFLKRRRGSRSAVTIHSEQAATPDVPQSAQAETGGHGKSPPIDGSRVDLNGIRWPNGSELVYQAAPWRSGPGSASEIGIQSNPSRSTLETSTTPAMEELNRLLLQGAPASEISAAIKRMGQAAPGPSEEKSTLVGPIASPPPPEYDFKA